MVQISLVLTFLAMLRIKLWDDLSALPAAGITLDVTHRLTGFSSPDHVATTILVMVFAVLACYVLTMVIEFNMHEEIGIIRLAGSGALPELDLAAGMRWHIFLSHRWDSGQDQCATIKRRLCLVLPGVRVFLDIDDRMRRELEPATTSTCPQSQA